MKPPVLGAVLFCALAASIGAQQDRPPESVQPIDPGGVALPSEADSAGITKFSFFAYGDTRGQVDGQELQPDHARVIEAMLNATRAEARAGFPVRFVLQSGDAVTTGGVATQWNFRFNSLIERLMQEGGVPYFLAVGNHDIAGTPSGTPEWERLGNTAAAMSKLWPPEGSPRRLDKSATYAFGFGRFFFIALDSNITSNETQRVWVERQLESLDRTRYPHVIAFFHHPPITSGSHGGASAVETQSLAMRRIYLPLFRRHHVRMTIAGHDHLLDHWVEHYADDSGVHRMDHIVTGGGGAPIYVYNGEPDVKRYAAEAAPQRVRIEHLASPGPNRADNPHHFLIFEVDGDQMWVQAVGTGPAPYLPYGHARLEIPAP